MSRYVHRAVAILAVLAAFAAGCASTEQYARFARAGTVYTAAIDRLLVAAGNIGIDATSERLLQDDVLKNQNLESYRRLSSVDVERLAIIGRLRAHSRLLARYFELLNELTTSDEPERAEQAIGGVVNGLNSLGTVLRGSPLVPNSVRGAISSVTKLAVGFAIRGHLREELSKRKDTIRIELNTQEELLKLLANTVQHDLTIINEAREKRLVIDPLLHKTPVAKPDEWAAHRRMILTSQAKVAELATASDAAHKLREAFEDIVEGKLDLDRINTLLTDLESILAVAQAINR